MRYAILFIFCLCTRLIAVQGQVTDKAFLSGNVNGFSTQPLVVYNNGDKYDTLSVATDGSFRFVHSLSTVTESYLYVVDDSITRSFCLYEKPGKSLRLDLNKSSDGIVSLYSGDTADESRFNNRLREICSLSHIFSTESWLNLSDFCACKEYVTENFRELNDILSVISDTAFVLNKQSVLEQTALIYYIDYAIAKQKNGIDMRTDTCYVNFIRQINLNDVRNIAVIAHFLNWYVITETLPRDTSAEVMKLKYAKQLVKSQAVLNKLAEESYSMILFLKMYGGKTIPEENVQLYRQILEVSTDEALCRDVEKMLNTEKNFVKGAVAAKLLLTDIKGNEIYLTDIVGHGHYTYIDFWATWCGPCCKEIPYVASLSEKYKGNNDISFVSISLDENKEAWVRKITTDNPSWEQYHVPKAEQKTWSSVYSISAIPRFMLFDKEGRLVDAYASRPSDPKTEELIQNIMQ